MLTFALMGMLPFVEINDFNGRYLLVERLVMEKIVLHRHKLIKAASRLYFFITALAAIIAVTLLYLES